MSAPTSAPLFLSGHSLLDSSRPSGVARRIQRAESRATDIRQVLACLDGSALGRGVVPHAQRIANALGAKLTLLHVLESDPAQSSGVVPPDPLDWGIRQREAQARLANVLADLSAANSEIESELIQGRPAEQICHWAENHDIDLTVLCSHGSRGLTDWKLASTARKLIERIPGSILLVPGTVAAQAGPARYRRILVPLDGSARAESVVPLAMRIAASEAAEVVLVHIVTPPEMLRLGLPDAEGAELERRVVEHNRRIAAEYLNRLRGRVSRTGARVRALVLTDTSARARLEKLIRDEQTDLVVMAAHGGTGRLDSPCGSVTEYVLTHATVPMLVLRDRTGRSRRRVGEPSPDSGERFAAKASTPS